MAYLGVGIHDNVVLDKKTGWNNEGHFSIALKTKTSDTAAFDGLLTGETITEEASVELKQFALKPTSWDNKPLSAAEIASDIQKFQLKLQCFMLMYMPADKVKSVFGINIFAGLVQDPAQLKTMMGQLLTNPAALEAIYKNIVNIFLRETTPHFETEPFRIKLERASKKKHYSSIPNVSKMDKPLEGVWETPFIELMSVPADQSKVKWSEWEIKNGKNDGTPLASDAENSAQAEQGQAAVQQLFATPQQPAAPAGVAEVPPAPTAQPEVAAAPQPAVPQPAAAPAPAPVQPAAAPVQPAATPNLPEAAPVAPAVAFNQG